VIDIFRMFIVICSDESDNVTLQHDEYPAGWYINDNDDDRLSFWLQKDINWAKKPQ
jgi:hypothetical protein